MPGVWICSSCKIAISALFCLTPLFAQSLQPQLWYWHHSLLNSPQNLASSEALIDRAVAAGYTGVAFWDVSSEFLNSPLWPSGASTYYQQAMAYAQAQGLRVAAPGMPYGYSNDVLENNPNWAESQRVVGTQYQVSWDASALQIINSFPGLQNPSFESGAANWLDMGDAGVSIDTSIAHSGSASALISNAPANGRIRQWFALQPWRQYHLRFFVKSQGYYGWALFSILNDSNFSISLLSAPIFMAPTQDWTEMDYTFNSQNTTQAWLYMGVYGGSQGNLWLDDIQIEETGLIYLTRRTGTPVQVYDPNNPNAVFVEGSDYNYISDPYLTASLTPFDSSWHTPPTVTLPWFTTLQPGQIVAIDSYSAQPTPTTWGQNMCFTDPDVLNYVQQNAVALSNVVPPRTTVLLGYDEIRQMNSCASCKALNMTPGQLLAWSVGQSIQTYNSVFPGSPLWIWSDMFDPYENAVANYYNVEGDLSGSWTGVPGNVIILNWNWGNLTNSLNWFAGTNIQQPVAHNQIIAGYYDSGDGTGAAQSELASASGVPGVLGLMYTTWYDDYSQLENFAAAVYANWPTYLNSIAASNPILLSSNLPAGAGTVSSIMPSTSADPPSSGPTAPSHPHRRGQNSERSQCLPAPASDDF
jgi:hypothetical protein